MVGPDTAVISFQNGVLKDQYLRAAFDERQVMGGVGYVATTIEAPGVIRQTGPMQRLLFGEFDGSRSARGEALLAACLAGGIKAELSTDIVARDLAEIRVPGRSVRHDHDDPQDHRADPLESADPRASCTT